MITFTCISAVVGEHRMAIIPPPPTHTLKVFNIIVFQFQFIIHYYVKPCLTQIHDFWFLTLKQNLFHKTQNFTLQSVQIQLFGWPYKTFFPIWLHYFAILICISYIALHRQFNINFATSFTIFHGMCTQFCIPFSLAFPSTF